MKTKLQMAMFPPKSDWLPPEHPFPEIFDAPEIAIDVETRDPNLREKGPGWATNDGEVVGYGIAVPGWKGYFPIAHVGGGNMDARQINKYLKKVFLRKEASLTKIQIREQLKKIKDLELKNS